MISEVTDTSKAIDSMIKSIYIDAVQILYTLSKSHTDALSFLEAMLEAC